MKKFYLKEQEVKHLLDTQKWEADRGRRLCPEMITYCHEFESQCRDKIMCKSCHIIGIFVQDGLFYIGYEPYCKNTERFDGDDTITQ